ncbi:MAG: TIGR00180 family glycosyltransferase [Candidatus Hodarchaeales archaeon]
MRSTNYLSLVIPTYNRPSFLQRLLTYFDKQNVNYEIVIPDSSSDEIKTNNKKIISSFSKLRINHLDHFSSETNFYHKIAQTVDFLNMKYTVLCADDDYIIPTALDKSVAFLEKNPDFTAVGGYYLAFLKKVNKSNKKKFYWKEYLASLDQIKPYSSLTSSDHKSRLINHLTFYLPTLYYVHETNFLRMIQKEALPYMKELDFASSFGELLLDMLTVIYGKIKTLDIFYGARESVLITKDSSSKYSGIIKPIKDGTYGYYYGKFKNCLMKHLSQEAGISDQEAENIIDQGMNFYLNRSIRNISSSRIKRLFRSFRRSIYFFQINLTQYHMLSLRKQIDLRKWNLSDPPSNYLEEFKQIRKSVLNENYGREIG